MSLDVSARLKKASGQILKPRIIRLSKQLIVRPGAKFKVRVHLRFFSTLKMENELKKSSYWHQILMRKLWFYMGKLCDQLLSELLSLASITTWPLAVIAQTTGTFTIRSFSLVQESWKIVVKNSKLEYDFPTTIKWRPLLDMGV